MKRRLFEWLQRAFALICMQALCSASAGPIATLTMESADHDRAEGAVSAVLPSEVGIPALFSTWEVTNGSPGVTVRHQLDPVEARRIWLLPESSTPAGKERRFEIRTEPGNLPLLEGDAPQIQKNDKALTIAWGERRIFQYNHAPVPPPTGVDPLFTRSGYIHPMWAPMGQLVTEDHPKDHYHHKGVWMPWTHTKFEGREVDFWNLGDKKGLVRFAGFEKEYSGPVFSGFIVKHEHVDLTAPGGEKIALNEIWDVRVWRVGAPRENGTWVWDLTSTQTCASDSPLELLEYRYGGLGFRGAKEWKDDNYIARASNGKTHKDGHTTRAKWCDHAGKVDGRQCGVLILTDPRNFRFPEPMRLWDKGGAFFNWAPSQAGDFKIEPGKPHISRYRFVVHDGDLTIEQCEAMWSEYAEPPQVEVTVSK